ncbi:MAG: IS4 family transposase [Desulfobacteraceae bacterium]|nr:IS4 family transposase [Desulfobacteraceae bacterium]
MSDMLSKKTAIVNQLCGTHSEQIGTYRFLNNPDINLEDLIQASYIHCGKHSKGLHVLSIQDTSEINYQRIAGKLKANDKDIGPVGNNTDAGFFLHPNLVVDTAEMFPIGFSSIILWNRAWDKLDKNERNYRNLPIEEKESYRWLSSVTTSKTVLKEAEHITIVGDRENDIYEELVHAPDNKTDLLIRSSINRKLYNSKKKLFEILSESELHAVYEIEVKGNKKREDRIAEMQLRFEKVKIARPSNLSKYNLPEYVELWAIEAREQSESVPEGEEEILWRILTTHEIKNTEDALLYIQWYAFRWQIEQLFRLLKSKGFNIESSQLGKGISLKKLCVMSLQVVLQIMQLTLSRDGENNKKAELIFTGKEIKFLHLLHKKLEGKTKKLQNPHIPGSMAWASWIISRLGGWKGYTSQSPPGHITIKKGLDIFFQQYTGWKLAIEMLN